MEILSETDACTHARMLKIQQRKLMPEIWHTKTDRTTRARLFHNHTKPENSTHLADVDLLEPPLEGGVLLNVLPVLSQRSSADAPKLATCLHTKHDENTYKVKGHFLGFIQSYRAF
jgi:hypothetical protein